MQGGVSIPPDRIVSEVIDGEVVAIDLDSGRYYSLEGAAARVWEMLQAGHDVEGIAAMVAGDGGLSPDEARLDIQAFVSELAAEGLVIAPDGAGQVAQRPGHLPLVLNRYTDMADLIVIDPIHDVDETGWPNRRPE